MLCSFPRKNILNNGIPNVTLEILSLAIVVFFPHGHCFGKEDFSFFLSFTLYCKIHQNIIVSGSYVLEKSAIGETAMPQVKVLLGGYSLSLVKVIKNTVRKLMIDRHKIISVGSYSNDVCDVG